MGNMISESDTRANFIDPKLAHSRDFPHFVGQMFDKFQLQKQKSLENQSINKALSTRDGT